MSESAPAKSASEAPAFIMPTSSAWTSEIHQELAKPPSEQTSRNRNDGQPTLLATLSGPSNGFSDLALIDEGRRIVMPIRRTNTVVVWDIASAREVGEITADPGMVFAVCVTDDESFVALGMNNKTVELWDLVAKERRAVLTGHTQNLVDRLAVNPDGTLLASAGLPAAIKLWNVKQGKETFTLPGLSHTTGLAFSHDGLTLASMNFNGTIILWDPKTGTEEGRFDTDSESVYCLAYVGQTSLVAVGDSDGMLTYWDTETGDKVAAVRAHTGILYSLAIAGDCRLLATGGEDKLVKLWDVIELDEVAALRGHDEVVVDVRLTQDGKRLASKGGGSKNEIKLWDIEPYKLLGKQ
jgi:WD40 repeat protein